jgi:hypothetical protein
MGGVVLHTHKVSETFSWKAGLYYNHEFFGNFFMPLAGLDWQIKDDLWLYGTLPGNLQLHKVLSSSFAFSLSYASPNGSLLAGDTGDYVRVARSFPPNVMLMGDIHWTVISPVTVKASFGHSLWRNYGLYSSANEKYDTGVYADYKDGFVIQASIVARVQNN